MLLPPEPSRNFQNRLCVIFRHRPGFRRDFEGGKLIAVDFGGLGRDMRALC